MIRRLIIALFNLVYGTGFGAAPAGEAVEAELAKLNKMKQGFTE